MSASELRPDFTGVWEADLEKSILHGPVPKRMLVRIQHREPQLVQQVLVTYADGRTLQLTAQYQTGAARDNLIGGATLHTRAEWQGSELLLDSTMESPRGKVRYKDYWSLSADGRMLTMEHRDDDLAGQISILEKRPTEESNFDETWGRS